MENAPLKYRQTIYGWDSTYKNLKHLRWLRNQLAHEVGAFESDLCKAEDIEILDSFFNSVLKSTDPLATLRKLRRLELNKVNQQNKTYVKSNRTQVNENSKQRTSFLRKIIEKIKRILS